MLFTEQISYTNIFQWELHARNMEACQTALNNVIKTDDYKDDAIRNIITINIDAMTKNYTNTFEKNMPTKYRFMIFCTGFFGKAVGKAVCKILGIYAKDIQIKEYSNYAKNRSSLQKIEKKAIEILTKENRETIRKEYSAGRKLSAKYSIYSVILSIGGNGNSIIDRFSHIIKETLFSSAPTVRDDTYISKNTSDKTVQISEEIQKIRSTCHEHWCPTFPFAKPTTTTMQTIRIEEKNALRVIQGTPFLTENSLVKINKIKVLATQIQTENKTFNEEQSLHLKVISNRKTYGN